MAAEAEQWLQAGRIAKGAPADLVLCDLDAPVRIAAALALSAPLATPAVAATWSDTFLGYRYGTQFHEPISNVNGNIRCCASND